MQGLQDKNIKKDTSSREVEKKLFAEKKKKLLKGKNNPKILAVGPGIYKRADRIKVKSAELIMFTNQLSIMLDSGVVLSDALDVIAQQTDGKEFKAILNDISETVKAGDNFSGALSKYPKVFSKMFLSMVKASEASGKMVEMLSVLSGYLEFEADTRKKIKGALTYPFIMALVAVAATGTLMFFVLPRFTKIYDSRGVELPLLTQWLVKGSALMCNLEFMAVMVTLLVIGGFAFNYWKNTYSGRKFIDYLKIKSPVIGSIFVDTLVTRSMRIMATMVNTGVTLLESIEVIQDSCGNIYFEQLWSRVNKKIKDGYQLSESLRISNENQLIVPGIIQMFKAGEKSGKLGKVSDKISIFYENKLHSTIKHAMTLIEPIMIIILGSIIGTIAIALLLPVFRVSSVVAH